MAAALASSWAEPRRAAGSTRSCRHDVQLRPAAARVPGLASGRRACRQHRVRRRPGMRCHTDARPRLGGYASRAARLNRHRVTARNHRGDVFGPGSRCHRESRCCFFTGADHSVAGPQVGSRAGGRNETKRSRGRSPRTRSRRVTSRRVRHPRRQYRASFSTEANRRASQPSQASRRRSVMV
jgi:hypothetical protein